MNNSHPDYRIVDKYEARGGRRTIVNEPSRGQGPLDPETMFPHGTLVTLESYNVYESDMR